MFCDRKAGATLSSPPIRPGRSTVRRWMRGIYHAHHAEPDTGVADVGIGGSPAAQRGLVAAIAPGEAAEEAFALRAAAQPLADGAEHVVGAHAAGGVATDRRGLRGAVAAREAVIVELGLAAGVVHVAARAGAPPGTAARRAQPLVLRRQPVRLPGAARQPRHVSHRIVP